MAPLFTMNIRIDQSWKDKLQEEFEKKYFSKLVNFVKHEYSTYSIFPPPNLIFSAFDNCSFEDTKVVILGQDPYHGEGQAHGLSFSVPNGVKKPPSLLNIFKEIYNDVNAPIPESGNLLRWSKQGVLLLNSILTVKKGMPGSHQMKGWEIFTDSVIKLISINKKNIVFLLWGAYAYQKGLKINDSNHLIIHSAHPSPFSAYKGFFNSKPFSRCNNYLLKHNKVPIQW